MGCVFDVTICPFDTWCGAGLLDLLLIECCELCLSTCDFLVSALYFMSPRILETVDAGRVGTVTLPIHYMVQICVCLTYRLRVFIS